MVDTKTDVQVFTEYNRAVGLVRWTGVEWEAHVYDDEGEAFRGSGSLEYCVRLIEHEAGVQS